MQEIWKDIRGYEGLYQVSNMGRVKSLRNNKGEKRELIKKLHDTKNGYLDICLHKDAFRKIFLVHRLVISTFKPIDNMNKLQVNHINENKTDNRLENLEWCTAKYNTNFGSRNERVAQLISIPIAQINIITNKIIKVWKNACDAEKVCGFCASDITACCKGKPRYKSHKGFKWMYLSAYMDKYCGIIE